ncbi:MAG TPA: amino acid permease [Phycisphaerae bacterium]
MNNRINAGLVRGIRRWDLLALVLNSIIGAGIFGLPSKVFALAGPYSLAAYVVCAVPVVLIVLCFAELGSRFNETGGPYIYTQQAFGSFIGFEVGWLMWLARVTAFASLCNLFVGYLGYFWPAVTTGWWRVTVIGMVVVCLTVVNLVGVRRAAWVGNAFTLGKLIPLMLFVATGVFFIHPGNYSLVAPPGYHAFSSAVLLLVFAFSGFEVAVIPAGEVRDPQRHMPFALLVGIGIVAVLYVLVQFVCIGTLPALATSDRPLADAAQRFFGGAGAAVVSLGALISVTGTLNAIMLAAPRLLFAQAERAQLPRCLALTHPRFHTPHLAILVSAIIMLVLTLWGTFISALTISTITRLVAYALTCAAVPVLRRRRTAPAAAFLIPAGALVATLALTLCIWLLSNSAWSEARLVLMAAALGLIILAVNRVSRPTQARG